MGAWHHVAAAYRLPSDTARIYVDGTTVASGDQGPFEWVHPTLLLGARGPPDHPDGYWSGQLDEVQVHTTALITTAVQSLDVDPHDLIRFAEDVTPSPSYGGKSVRIVDTGVPIGIDRNTKQVTTEYTVITNSKDYVHTMYPGRP